MKLADFPIMDTSSSSASWTSPGAGITRGYDGTSLALRVFIVFATGLAMYNACELLVIISLTFTKFKGLYFWSLLVAGLGVILYSLGFLLKFMDVTTGDARWLSLVLITLGWYPMTTGQALVLWSRLHLIVSGERGDAAIRYTMWMIVINAIVFHIPTTVLTFGSNGSVDMDRFRVGYNIMEKIQMIGFFLQEFTLSSIYIVETCKILRTSLQPGTQTIMKQLLSINVVIIVMDLGLLGLECASLYIFETLLKGVLYSIKLKLEIAILSKLVRFVGRPTPHGTGMRESSIGFVNTDSPGQTDSVMDVRDFVDFSKIGTDVSQPSQLHPSGARNSPMRSLDLDVARFEHAADVSTMHAASPSNSDRIAEV